MNIASTSTIILDLKIYLDQCDSGLKYLFNILENENIPFQEREKVAHSILTEYLNVKTSYFRDRMICYGYGKSFEFRT